VYSLDTLRPRPEIVPRTADIEAVVERIKAAERILVMCGGGCQGAAKELRALSDRLKAPLVHSVKGKDIMAYDDPRWMGGVGMIGTKPVYQGSLR
jgi:thiamine pyrophosphate-dependent acetolactate synthase large subunit-like protein